MTNMNGVHCQTSTAASVKSARLGSPSHWKPGMPTKWLTQPKLGLNNARQVIPTTTGLRTIGIINSVRNTERQRETSPHKKRAMAKPRINSPTTVGDEHRCVCQGH